MDKLKAALNTLDIRNIAESRVIYQVMDLEMIKFKGMESGEILPEDEIREAIDDAIRGFMWLYSKGMNLERTLDMKKLSAEEQQRYDQFKEAFGVFTTFMQTHMHLTTNG